MAAWSLRTQEELWASKCIIGDRVNFIFSEEFDRQCVALGSYLVVPGALRHFGVQPKNGVQGKMQFYHYWCLEGTFDYSFLTNIIL